MPQYGERSFTSSQPFRPLQRSNRYLSDTMTSQTWMDHGTKQSKKQKNSQKRLFEEIKRTNNNLRIRRFRQNLRLNNKYANDKTFDPDFSSNDIDNVISSCQSRSFSQFLRKKKSENAYMASKMKVFGNTLTERSKAKVQCEINQQLKNNFNSMEQNKGEDEKNRIKKMKKYLICHKILENLFQLMVKNPQKISLKTQTPDLYMNLKKEMVEVIIDEQSMLKINKKIDQELKAMKEVNFTFNKKKLIQMSRNNSSFYLLKEKKKDELTEQIEKHLDYLKLLVTAAIQDFNNKYSNNSVLNQWNVYLSGKEVEEETRIE